MPEVKRRTRNVPNVDETGSKSPSIEDVQTMLMILHEKWPQRVSWQFSMHTLKQVIQFERPCSTFYVKNTIKMRIFLLLWPAQVFKDRLKYFKCILQKSQNLKGHSYMTSRVFQYFRFIPFFALHFNLAENYVILPHYIHLTSFIV